MNKNYEHYCELKSKIADINSAIAILSWDQEVNMPPDGFAFRAQQLSTLAGIMHELGTSKEYEDIISELVKDNSLSFKEKKNVQESFRIITRDKKLPTEFITKLSQLVSESYEAWIRARKADDYSVFAPYLEKIVQMHREKAELIGYTGHPYDALLDDYDQGLTTKELDRVFADVKIKLTAFVKKLRTHAQPDTHLLDGPFDKAKQMELCRLIATDLGYKWSAGRIDLSAHPFSTSFSPQDSRITTRVSETNLAESIWGTIHETGHAMYEQGLPTSEYGLPSGEAISLAIHESQSRLWENNVGKSWPFINAYWPTFQAFFPDNFKEHKALDFFKAINISEPNLIRINSDEVTYHFHILLRYEIEKGLIDGTYKVDGLDKIWNEKIKEYLGLDVPSAREGILQDIHWSHGSIGYFPTYSLGSFYAAQFFHFASLAIPGLDKQIENKEFSHLLQWLHENIHQFGHIYTSQEICQKVCGEELDYKYFDAYLHRKYGLVYGF